MKIIKEAIRKEADGLGFDLCGFASVDRFSDYHIHLQSVLPDCQTVIIVAKTFLRGTLYSGSTIPYTIVRNQMSVDIDIQTIRLASYLENSGALAVPVGAIGPTDYDKKLDKSMGLISLKYSAVQAGLGVIGKNTLLLTPEYGNMVWLGGILTNAVIDADQVKSYNPCNESCRLCIDKCPVRALDGSVFMDQGTCWDYAFGEPEEGGEWRIKCYECRKICPHCLGYTERPVR